MTAHLHPTAPIAADVLLPADPALAMTLAQRLLDKPLMANHNHGLWGYSGRDAEGRELTVQATGIGGPSAAVVVAELADHGARRAIRLGLCRALDPALAPGDAVIADAVLAGEATSRALGVDAAPDTALTDALARAAGPGAVRVTIASAELFHEPEREARDAARAAAGAAVADLETAAVLACARHLGLPAASALVVTGLAATTQEREGTQAALETLAEAAARALAETARDAQASDSETASLL